MMDNQDKMVCPRRWLPALDEPKPDAWREDQTCSYCGSMHPDEFLRRVEAGEEITPTDKNYKAYTVRTAKFYFQHFTDEQKRQFIDLLNQTRVKFAAPGHFYVLPYFICTGPKDGTST